LCCDRCDVGQTQLTIDTLPDDPLLYVFDFYVAQASEVEAWHTLVHVCRRWRHLVFGSPRRLNLRVFIRFINETPVTEKLDIWPPLPIIISGGFIKTISRDSIKAVHEHHDRVCKIDLFFHFCELGNIIALLEEPFPMLTDMNLSAIASFQPFDPDPPKSLGGSACLRSLTLDGVRIPGLPNLLLSTPNLVILRLDKSGSFLPDEIVTVLSALTRLEQLDLYVEFGRSHPKLENRLLPLLTRTVLPSLTNLKVRGDPEALEDFMARIDTPLLDNLSILFSFSWFDRVIVLDTPHLLRFIGRIPKLQALIEAYLGFESLDVNDSKIWIIFLDSNRRYVFLEIVCAPERQIPCLAEFCRMPAFPLHSLEYLCIAEGQIPQQHERNHTENTRWLELLRPFGAVRCLYLTKEFALHIAHALQELVGERVMEVLPTLENVFIDEFGPSGPVHEIIKGFAAARQLAGHPIIISHWEHRTGERLPRQ
jgi:hypothetical protein